jgi:hypothetical protein
MAKKHRQNAAKSSAEVDETGNEAVALLTTAQVAKRPVLSGVHSAARTPGHHREGSPRPVVAGGGRQT